MPSTQSGVSLIMVLLFLVAITGLTVWAARQSMLGEGMARNQLDLEIARQAAESALRDAERDLKNATPGVTLTNAACSRGSVIIPAKFDATCTTGLCYQNDAYYAASEWQHNSSGNTVNPEPWWPTGKGGTWNDEFKSKPSRTIATTTGADSDKCDFKGGVPLGTYTGAPVIRGVAIQPEYLIEYFKRSIPTRQESAVYRITARGFGYAQRTQVVLQTTFVPE